MARTLRANRSTAPPAGRRPRARSATIREVARAAGVSVATVSRALNAKGPVRAATVARVRSAAERLDYHPHGAARSLITRQTHTIGVLLPDLHGEFFSEVIRGIDLAARRRGYHLLLSSSHSDPAEVYAALRAMRGRVDGLIVMFPAAPAVSICAHLPHSLPAVLLNTPPDGAPCDVLRVDNHGGAAAMVGHLVEQGHRSIAFLGGPPDNFDAVERRRGFRDALAALRLEPAVELEGDFTEESGQRAGRALVARRTRPDAVFAANDAMAIGLLTALRESGVAVPGDIALGGFDDIPLARLVDPPLTSVRVPIAALGQRALERLFVAVGNGHRHAPEHALVATELVVRDSTRDTHLKRRRHS